MQNPQQAILPQPGRTLSYVRLMRLDRPIGIFLLLWPTAWALWIAGQGQPDQALIVIFGLGVVLMRSAGCVINDYADRELDPLVARTQSRPLAAGHVHEREALALFAVLIGAAFALVLLTNLFTILLSFGGAALAIAYPFMKRYTHLPQLVLGAAFAWSVPMSFAAQLDHVPNYSWLIYIATVLWAVAYDTMYAMVDREDDIKAGIRSTAILFGEADRLVVGVLQACVLACLYLLGDQLDMSAPYYMGMAVAGGFFVYQQVLIRNRQPEACFHAFLNNNWVGLAIFVGIILHYLQV